MKKFTAYWISPEGDIFGVPRKHINFIRDNLSLFGITLDDYKEIYDKYQEKYGFEGNARREIMLKAIKQGWIRIRYKVNSGWTVELWEMNDKASENLDKWEEKINTDKELVHKIYVSKNNKEKEDE
jgi:hypothetical protein